jgi:hypothetical protein
MVVAKDSNCRSLANAPGLGNVFQQPRTGYQGKVNIHSAPSPVDLPCGVVRGSHTVTQRSEIRGKELVERRVGIARINLSTAQRLSFVTFTHALDIQIAPMKDTSLIHVCLKRSAALSFVDFGIRNVGAVNVSWRSAESCRSTQPFGSLHPLEVSPELIGIKVCS